MPVPGSTSEPLRGARLTAYAARPGAGQRRATLAPRRVMALAACVLMAVAVWPARADDALPCPGPSLRASIGGALVHLRDTQLASYHWPREPAIIALYYGADWCGPCHAFVPTLREVRDALRAAGADTEVVFVSLDTTEADMRRYMRLQQMPWPAIAHQRLRTLPSVRALGGAAPPNLVLIDRQGRVLASAWSGRRYTGLQPVLDAWLQAVQMPEAAAQACATQPQPAGLQP